MIFPCRVVVLISGLGFDAKQNFFCHGCCCSLKRITLPAQKSSVGLLTTLRRIPLSLAKIFA